MSKRLVVGNWKGYIRTQDEAKKLARSTARTASRLTGIDVAVAPSFTLLPVVAAALKRTALRVAAQTISPFQDEKQTGEVSGKMLSSLGISAVIVGHSERRALGETDDMVGESLERAQEAGLRSILCVGEKERDHGGAHFSVVAEQLHKALVKKPSAAKLVVAYEPVWAIGHSASGAMSPGEVQEMVIFIRKVLSEELGRTAAMRIPVLYGGSVEGENAAALLREGGISGFLVGHASSEADAFAAILNICGRKK